MECVGGYISVVRNACVLSSVRLFPVVLWLWLYSPTAGWYTPEYTSFGSCNLSDPGTYTAQQQQYHQQQSKRLPKTARSTSLSIFSVVCLDSTVTYGCVRALILTYSNHTLSRFFSGCLHPPLSGSGNAYAYLFPICRQLPTCMHAESGPFLHGGSFFPSSCYV